MGRCKYLISLRVQKSNALTLRNIGGIVIKVVVVTSAAMTAVAVAPAPLLTAPTPARQPLRTDSHEGRRERLRCATRPSRERRSQELGEEAGDEVQGEEIGYEDLWRERPHSPCEEPEAPNYRPLQKVDLQRVVTKCNQRTLA